jgi:hypothetical protein
MTWNRDWSKAATNIFEALRIDSGDRLAVLYNSLDGQKKSLADALAGLAKQRGIPIFSEVLELPEGHDSTGLEARLCRFFEGTRPENRKFFFTAAKRHFGPARRAVHRLISVDPKKLYGYTISLAADDADIISDLAATSPNALWERGQKLKAILTESTKITITSKKGTNLTFDWEKDRRKYLVSAGFPHTHEDRWDNMGGEVYTAPLHETVNGRLVIDGAIANIGLVDGTIVVDIKNGKGSINRNDSTAPARQLDELDEELNIYPCACVVGEFGIGTTPGLKLTGELLNDEKVEGTIHIAFGDSYSADGSGGENDCDAHTDCIILSPTVDMLIDGKGIRMMDEGKFLV